MSSKRLFLLLTLVLYALPVQAERPKIGLALAGGGAKGSAHIAVLELLEANNIPIDYIAGTSIGAYIGGLYALGYSAAEIKEIMYSVDMASGYSDAIDRDLLRFRTKRQTDKFNLGLEAGFSDGQFRIPWGILYGQSATRVFRRSAGNIPNFDSFDDLAIPFRAIATDLATNDIVVLASGNLLKAMKASATVPGALVPVEIDDQFLVDGGMAQNLPITEVRNMGADIVIAIDISSPLMEIENIDNAINVFNQISGFLTVRNIEEQKKLLGADDVYIRPQVDELSTTDFSRLDEAYDSGRIAAEEKLESLKKLSVDVEEYQRHQKEKKSKFDDLMLAIKQPVVEIMLVNLSSYNDAYLLHTLDLHTGAAITTEALIDAIDRVYALDHFERVDATFEQREDGRILIVEVVQKSWGPNYLEVGLGWEDDFDLESTINLDFAYTIGNITDKNGEWRNEVGLGTDKTFRSELYLPQDFAHDFYQSAILQVRRENRNYFIENERALVFRRNSQQIDWGLGYNFDHRAIAEAGFTFERGDFSNVVVLTDDIEYSSKGFYLMLGYDTLDRISFPTRGDRLTISVTLRNEDINGESIFGDSFVEENFDSTQTLLDWKSALSSGNHGIVAKLSIAYTDSDIDRSAHLVTLGGFLNLSGYHRDSLVGNDKFFGALSYQYDLGRSALGLESFPLYLGASLEAGNVWAESDSIDFDELIPAGSVFAGTDSRLGPIILAVGFSEANKPTVYFYLGKNI
jgi:NTE family protein